MKKSHKVFSRIFSFSYFRLIALFGVHDEKIMTKIACGHTSDSMNEITPIIMPKHLPPPNTMPKVRPHSIFTAFFAYLREWAPWNIGSEPNRDAYQLGFYDAYVHKHHLASLCCQVLSCFQLE